MSKGVGLDAGEYEIKVVELDGSYKRPRLAKVSIDRVSQTTAAVGDQEHASREAEVALQALKDANVSRDNVILGFPCREAVLRVLDVPFKGVDQIRKVIKFEVEDTIHSHSVDDMVVDFHVLGDTQGGTRVLVAAVPKQPLRVTLEALASLGIEPEIVDLDTMALYRAAQFAGCFNGLGDAEGPPEEEHAEKDGEKAKPKTAVAAPGQRRMRVVIDVGGRSTRILAVVAGELIDMRALRVGVDGIADDIASSKGVDVRAAREAVFKVFESGKMQEISRGEPAAAEPEAVEGAVVAAAEAPAHLAPTEVSASASELLRRLHRELMRFVASMQGIDGVEAVFVTGGGSFLPGLDEVLADVFGCPPRPLPMLARLNHNLDEKEAAWVEPRIAVAVGLALGSMGGVGTFQFRQEELAFQRRFDRVKFPLAIACMLTIFLIFLSWMRLDRQVGRLEEEYGKLHKEERSDARGRQGVLKAELFGYVGNLINEKANYSCATKLDRKEFQNLLNEVVAADTFERLPVIEKFLRRYVGKQREATGIYEDLQLPSGYYVLARFADVIGRIENELGSFVVLSMKLDYDIRSPYFQFKVAVRGADYRARADRLMAGLRAEFGAADSPFEGFGDVTGASGEEVFQGEVEGVIRTIRLKLKAISA